MRYLVHSTFMWVLEGPLRSLVCSPHEEVDTLAYLGNSGGLMVSSVTPPWAGARGRHGVTYPRDLITHFTVHSMLPPSTLFLLAIKAIMGLGLWSIYHFPTCSDQHGEEQGFPQTPEMFPRTSQGGCRANTAKPRG